MTTSLSPLPLPEPDCWYYQELEQSGLIDKAREWLKKNPKPQYWKGGSWAWAHTEMPEQCTSCGGHCGTAPCRYESVKNLQLETIKKNYLEHSEYYFEALLNAMFYEDGKRIEVARQNAINFNFTLVQVLSSHITKIKGDDDVQLD